MSWVKLHRSLLQWEWYDDTNALRLLIHLLVSVNYEDKKWRGMLIPAGSMVFSWDTLSTQLGLSVKQCRVAMEKLENSGEVARKRATKGQLVSLTKWEKLQNNEGERADNGATKGQLKGRQRATTKEYKEVEESKEVKNKEIDKEKLFAEQVRSLTTKLPDLEIQKFIDYWTEKSPRGKKMKFEKQKTFDPAKRLKTWELNYFEWGKEKSSAKKEKPLSDLEKLQMANQARREGVISFSDE